MSKAKDQYRFEYDEEFFNPQVTKTEDERKAKAEANTDLGTSSKFEAPADARYIRPTGGRSWHEVKVELDQPGGKDCKLVFIARHGHAAHNELQEGWPRPVFDRYISQNPKHANSSLTDTGKTQVVHAGIMLRKELTDNLVFPVLWPGSFYTSPLRRCIETAAAITTAEKPSNDPELEVCVVDNFREWMGYDHNEQNDTRGTREEIEKHAKNVLKVKTKFMGSFPEEDKMFNQKPLQETWSQVDERWEAALNSIFETDSNKVICICGNNRSIQSGLRLIGHEADEKVLEDNFSIMNMGNGAIIAFLLRRHELKTSEVEDARLERERLNMVEEAIIKFRKAEHDRKAEEEVKAMAPHRIKELLELLGPKEKDVVQKLRDTKSPEN